MDSGEEADDGTVHCTSRVLEMSYDSDRGNQLVGIFWPQMAVPAGATIKSAYVTFQIDTVNNDGEAGTDQPISIDIYGEANPSEAPQSKNFDLSSRCHTKASVTWKPISSVKVGEMLVSADVSSIIEEIVGGSAWAPYARLGLLFKRAVNSGKGNRYLESVGYEGGAKTPSLTVIMDTTAVPKALAVPYCTDTTTTTVTSTTTVTTRTNTQGPRPGTPTTSTTSVGWCVSADGDRDAASKVPCDSFGNEKYCEKIPGCVWVAKTTTARPADIEKFSTTTSGTTTTVNTPSTTNNPGPAASTGKKGTNVGLVIAALLATFLFVGGAVWYFKIRTPSSGSKYAAVPIVSSPPDSFGSAVMNQVNGYEAAPVDDGANMWANTLPVDGDDDDELLA